MTTINGDGNSGSGESMVGEDMVDLPVAGGVLGER